MKAKTWLVDVSKDNGPSTRLRVKAQTARVAAARSVTAWQRHTKSRLRRGAMLTLRVQVER